MNNFKIGDLVKVIDYSDRYFGYVGRIVSIPSSCINDVYEYEVQFTEINQTFPNECRLGRYPGYCLASVSYADYYIPKTITTNKVTVNSSEKGYLFKNVTMTKKTFGLKPYIYDRIKNVYFNKPYTILILKDGRKAIVKCGEGEEYDPEKGLALAICKIGLGSNKSMSNYYDIFKKWLPKEQEVVHGEPELNTAAIVFHYGKENNNVQKILDAMPQELRVQLYDGLNNYYNVFNKLSKNDTEEEPKSEPIEPGYFLKREQERKNNPKPVAIPKNKDKEEKEEITPANPINYFVKSTEYEASCFAKDFINFCKKHDLYFYVVNPRGGMSRISPYDDHRAYPQKIVYYLKKGLLESCMKTRKSGKSYIAVDMTKAIFSRLPIDQRRANRKDNKEGGDNNGSSI
ncbi:MAG: hypothetical protein IK021_01785 [Methanobrevibacter sp.]|nr:hypothetical protein [Methanobrevibacter sp.]